jgi:hypothetical protein
MKAKLFILVCVVAALCSTGCNDDREVPVSSITVDPATIPSLEVGGTVELSAVILPQNATQDIRWVAYDTIVAIESNGAKAVLTAVAPGTTRIFATNSAGNIVSDEITVKVNSAEYASFVTGNYLGSGKVTGALNTDLTGVQVKIERIPGENGMVQLTLTGEVPGMGELTLSSQQITVFPDGQPDTYRFGGTAPLDMMGVAVPLAVTGMHSPGTPTLALQMTSDIVSISIIASPGLATDYGALVAGEYTGSAKLTGQLNVDLNGLEMNISRRGDTKVALVMEADIPGVSAVTITAEDLSLAPGAAPNTCTLTGTAKALMPAMELDMAVAGTFNTEDHTIALAFTNEMVTVDLTASKVGFDPSDFAKLIAGAYLGNAKLTGAMTADLTDVKTDITRVDNETVAVSVTADVPTLGTITVAGDAIAVTPGADPGTFALSGKASAALGEFDLTGAVNPENGVLLLTVASAVAVIDIVAGKDPGGGGGGGGDTEVALSALAIQPGTLSEMQVGETVTLTALPTPADAAEAIEWVVEGEAAAIAGSGLTATLTALAPGSAKVYARGKTGTVVSDPLEVTVTAPPTGDHARFVAGNFLGTAHISGAIEADITGVTVAFEPVENDRARLKMTVVATVPNVGDVTLADEALAVAQGSEENMYTLNGTAASNLGAFTVTGTYNAADSALILKLTSPIATIDVAAEKEDESRPTETLVQALAGNYSGTAVLAGLLAATIPDVPATLEVIEDRNDALRFTIVAPIPDMGEMTIVCEELRISREVPPPTQICMFEGEATLPTLNLPLAITGTYSADGMLSLQLEATGKVVTINYTGVK